MATPSQIKRKLLERRRQRKTLFGTKLVQGINPELDTMILDSAEGYGRPVPIYHPFLTTDAWIRAIPEKSSGVKTFQGMDNFNDIIQGYYYPNRDKLINNYREKKGVYRPLLPGEIELSSRGLAQTYQSADGRHEIRGGIINSWLDHITLEAGTWSPTHRRLLHNHKASDLIKDEERIGVVTRPDSNDPNITSYPKVDDKFAKEYLRSLDTTDGKKLVDKREGHVIDDIGAEVTGSFGNPLRVYHRYFNEDQDELDVEIDNQGNIAITLPSGAEDGATFSIPNGSAIIDIKDDLQISAAGNTFKMTEDGIELKAKNGVKVVMDNNGFTVNGHNVVYKEFLDYFKQTHLTSTGIGFMSWPVAHNPATIATFNAYNAIEGLIKSDSGLL